MRRLVREEEIARMVEYGLMVVLIAMLTIVDTNLQSSFTTVKDKL